MLGPGQLQAPAGFGKRPGGTRRTEAGDDIGRNCESMPQYDPEKQYKTMTIRAAINRLTEHERLNFILTNRIPRRALTRFMGWFSKIEQPLVRDCRSRYGASSALST